MAVGHDMAVEAKTWWRSIYNTETTVLRAEMGWV